MGQVEDNNSSSLGGSRSRPNFNGNQERNDTESLYNLHNFSVKRSERIKNYKLNISSTKDKSALLQRNYSCNECKAVLSSRSSLKIHYLLHSGERPFKCSMCEKRFLKQSNLTTHLRNHSGEKPYTCSECGRSFKLLSTLKSHLHTHTGEQPFECSICRSSFSQRSSLTRHKMTHTDIKPFMCDQCGRSFQNKNYFKKHLLNHILKAKHSCSICDEGFNNSKKLNNHMMTHNQGLKPIQCSKCNNKFLSLKSFKQHIRRVHNFDTPELRCEECDAQFKNKSFLKSHKKVHVGDIIINCDLCNASFNNSVTHRKHVRRHAEKVLGYGKNINKNKVSYNLTNFTCSACLKNYKSSRQLKAHKCNLQSDSNYDYNNHEMKGIKTCQSEEIKMGNKTENIVLLQSALLI